MGETAMLGQQSAHGRIAEHVMSASQQKSQKVARAGVQATAALGLRSAHGNTASVAASARRIGASRVAASCCPLLQAQSLFELSNIKGKYVVVTIASHFLRLCT